MHVLISGAGIGGLAAALALLRRGIDVTVFEQAAALREVGAGVQISPNGTRVLEALGLGSRMRELGTATSGKEVRLWNTGQTWRTMDLGAATTAQYGAPYLTFHRADLHSMLLDAVTQQKPDAVRLGAKGVGFTQNGATVSLRLASGEEVSGDALVGADGVHSTIRQQLFGSDRPVFTGCMAWRGLIPEDALPETINRTGGVSWLGPTAHILTYPVRQGKLLNFIGMVDRDDWRVESWSAAGSVDECAADFVGWHDDVQRMVRGIGTPFKWALIVREALPRWSIGRVTLLGDACHSTLPFLGQGANMSIEDGYVLADCVAEARDDSAAAFARYEDLRKERTKKIVDMAAAQTGKVHNPALAVPKQAEEHIAAHWTRQHVGDRYDWIYRYDATAAARVPVESSLAL